MSGGSGADTLTGGPGDDHLNGGPGSGTFDFNDISEGVDTIRDFETSAPGSGGDLLDIADVIDYVDATPTLAEAISANFVSLTDDGSGNTEVKVDPNGSTGGAAFTTLAILTTVTPGTAEADLADNFVLV